MTDQLEKLEPVPISQLLKEYSEFTLAELVLEIKEGKEALEAEKKQHAATTFARTKAEQLLETLEGRIKTASAVLSGESDICIGCEAVKDQDEED